MRDLFLHIGLHKTGTTYLQHLLLENRPVFEAAGIALAPYLHPQEGNHYAMVRALKAPGGPGLVAEALAAAPGARLLVTAEELCNHIMSHRDRAEALRDAVMPHFRPRIVVFVRRQDFLKESTFAQAVRTWYRGDIGHDNHYDLDHDGRVRMLEAVFGRENVAVRLYRDAGSNDILGGFLDAIDTSIDRSRLSPVGRRNITLPRRKILFLSQLPKPPRAKVDRRHMRMALFVARVLEGSEAVAGEGAGECGSRFMMSPDERRALVAAHLAGNRALVARHGIADAEHFLSLPEADEPWVPPRPITAAERRAVLGEVMRACWTRRNLVAALADSLQVGRAFAGMARREARLETG